jgi:hypothetical protein
MQNWAAAASLLLWAASWYVCTGMLRCLVLCCLPACRQPAGEPASGDGRHAGAGEAAGAAALRACCCHCGSLLPVKWHVISLLFELLCCSPHPTAPTLKAHFH